jgi:hypothetical protein
MADTETLPQTGEPTAFVARLLSHHKHPWPQQRSAVASDPSPAGTTEPEQDRFPVSLSPQTVLDLQMLKDDLGVRKTDSINRGVSLYRFVQQELAAGNQLLLRAPDGTIRAVTFL